MMGSQKENPTKTQNFDTSITIAKVGPSATFVNAIRSSLMRPTDDEDFFAFGRHATLEDTTITQNIKRTLEINLEPRIHKSYINIDYT